MDSDAVVVIDEAELAKAVHKQADAGPGCSDHLRKRFLRYLWNYRLKLAGTAEFRHQEENACQALLAGVEVLIHKISLHPHTARQQEFQEQCLRSHALRASRGLSLGRNQPCYGRSLPKVSNIAQTCSFSTSDDEQKVMANRG